MRTTFEEYGQAAIEEDAADRRQRELGGPAPFLDIGEGLKINPNSVAPSGRKLIFKPNAGAESGIFYLPDGKTPFTGIVGVEICDSDDSYASITIQNGKITSVQLPDEILKSCCDTRNDMGFFIPMS